MSKKLDDILNHVKKVMESQASPLDLAAFMALLFDPNEVIQIKQESFIHPGDAMYENLSGVCEASGITSKTGVQFCMNSVPPKFLEQYEYLQEIVALEQPQWDRIIPSLRNQLSLSCDLFEAGRTFFIEADQLANGKEIKTTEDKISVISEMISTDLPISYILDTGGRGPHIGIVLDRPIERRLFDQLVKNVVERLPKWIDYGVGRINQMERLPETFRMNKRGEHVEVRALHIGSRINHKELEKWIEVNAVVNPHVIQRQNFEPSELLGASDNDDAESAAWEFIRTHELKSAKAVSRGKIQVSCPNQAEHSNGRDRNMSAFINVARGFVYCSACKKRVGRTFEMDIIDNMKSPSLIPSSSEPVDLSTIKPIKVL